MDLIDQFLARYTKEYDFYSQAASITQQKLEAELQAAGVRCIVTARAKSFSSLEQKCRKREVSKGKYASIERIYDDIVDLAGARVALYFPGEIDQVDGTITRLFKIVEKRKFPDKEKVRPGNPRFSGYTATHYRVQLKEDDLSDTEKRYAAARIEIQVASVLMHAWSEVEHDLIYKPLAGELSEEEYALLDQLNGLVQSGEIALERMQKAGAARVATSNRRIANHYELAALLLSAGEGLREEPITDSGLGNVDLLFDFIEALDIDTPASLQPYIDALHGNVEMRPLADQIIDSLLVADQSYYQIYNSIREQRPWVSARTTADEELYRHIGMFMSRWMELEALVRQVSRSLPGRSPVLPTAQQLLTLGLISQDHVFDFESLRRMRNLLVHGVELPAGEQLDEAANRLDGILAEVRRQAENRGDHNPEPGAQTT